MSSQNASLPVRPRVLITGGGAGIGAAAAERCRADGYEPVIIDRVVDHVPGGIQADLSNAEDTARALRLALEGGPITRLVNNVGVVVPNDAASQTLAEFVGQTHLVGPGRLLREIIEGGRLHSLILWGPPGSGKRTVGKALSALTGAALLDNHLTNDPVFLAAGVSGQEPVREEVWALCFEVRRAVREATSRAPS